LLFVLSNDYGELASALNFLQGFDVDALVLAPGRLYGINAGDLAPRARPYGTVGDILAAVTAEPPDVVFLFSAYLYAVNNLLDLAQLASLVTSLRSRGCPVVTSDPFLGLMARVDESLFNESHPLSSVLARHFAQVFSIVHDIPHLYLVDPGGNVPVHRLSCFNPAIVRPPATTPGGLTRVPGTLGVDHSRPRWLFILSSEDYGAQMNAVGQVRFQEELVKLLRHAVTEGRQPVLIAPSPCVASLLGVIGSDPGGPILLAHCRHALFATLLEEAEHVFYWNLFSHSILERVMNRQSALFYSAGHLASAIPPFLELGIKTYYAGARPTYLSSSRLLSATEVARLAIEQDTLWEDARAHLARSASPAAVVAGLSSAPGARHGAS
jgi:hypothetical protein